MSKHQPVSRLRWQRSQKHTMLRWQKRDLQAERATTERRYLPILERYAKQYSDDGSILEIGCGPVCISQYLPQQHKVYLDPLIDNFRRLYPGELPESEHIATTAERIAKPNASFDLIICLNTISYSLNPELIMHEIERLLKPEGRFILAISTHFPVEARLHYWAERFAPILSRKSRPYHYSLKGIQTTLSRHFDIQDEIVQGNEISWLPFFVRKQRLFICSRKTGRNKNNSTDP